MYWKGINIIIYILLSSSLLGMTTNIEKLNDKKIEKYWKDLKEKADEMWNEKFDLDLGINLDVDESGEKSIGGSFKIPLYGKSEKRKKSSEKREFLEKGADYLEILQNNVKKIKILKEKERILRTIMTEQGVTSIKAYHEAKEERVEFESEIDSIIRKLEAMLR
ncbi:MAG: hypothetical protein ACQERZ_09660 [Fusobacteriota bacterium]